MNEEPPRDHVPGEYPDPDDKLEGREIEDHIKSRETWLRLLFMIVFVVLYCISRFVVGAVVVLLFFWVLFTGEVNERLRSFGQSLAAYTYQVVRYLTYNTDSRPFPFDDWPSGSAPPD